MSLTVLKILNYTGALEKIYPESAGVDPFPSQVTFFIKSLYRKTIYSEFQEKQWRIFLKTVQSY